MGIERAEVIARMRIAQREGLSASKFIKQMATAGLSYRRTTMLADWRSVGQLEKKEGLLRYIRKDYYPTAKTMAHVDWELSQEYMYKVKVHSRLRPDEPSVSRFVNITSDVPLTPEMLESEVIERWTEWERYAVEEITGLQVWSAVHKVME